MDFSKFVSVLDRSSLFFCNATKLSDPFEGTWSQANLEIGVQKNLPEDPDIRRAVLQGSERLRGQYSVNCWHLSEFESDAMWGLYATRDAGIAIQTNFESLRESFKSDHTVYIGQVKYIDYHADPMDSSHILRALLHKRHHFEHEREVRAIVEEPAQPSEQQTECYCEVDLSMLIKRVVVSPLAPPWLSELVISVAARYNLAAPVIASKLAERPA